MKTANFKYRVSLTETLLALPIGEERIFPSRVFATKLVRKRCTQLKKRGFLFEVSSPRDCVDTFVRRLQ